MISVSVNINCQPSPAVPPIGFNAIPAGALLDENNQPILDEDGQYIIGE